MMYYASKVTIYYVIIGCRVLDEISEVLGDRDFVTAEDVEQLQYMEQVHVSAGAYELPEVLGVWLITLAPGISYVENFIKYLPLLNKQKKKD